MTSFIEKHAKTTYKTALYEFIKTKTTNINILSRFITEDALCNSSPNTLNWGEICRCNDFPFEFVIKYHKYFDTYAWSQLCENQILPFNFVFANINNPDMKWDWHNISSNPNLTEHILLEHPDCPWEFHQIGKHKNITMDFIQNNFTDKWLMASIFQNPNLTLEMIMKYASVTPFKDSPCYSYAFSCANIPVIQMLNNPILQRSEQFRQGIYYNKNVSLNVVKNNPQISWCWWNISGYVATFQDVLDNPDLPWNWRGFAINKMITMDIMKDNLDKPWDWNYICYNPNVTMDFIEKYVSTETIIISACLCNPNITFKFIVTHQDKITHTDNWTFVYLSKFKRDMDCYVARFVEIILVMTILDFYKNNNHCLNCWELVEHVLMDEYLMMHIRQY